MDSSMVLFCNDRNGEIKIVADDVQEILVPREA